ncbi:MAG TPA: SNF2-related protein [Candidatus Cloacimonadota bacterium]|nr:SNF2-related protein [Candidatus Cloacimonadota bacterium]
MARLFRKEYHEHSNTWYFKKSLILLDPTLIEYRKSLDENGNYLFHFQSSPSDKLFYPAQVKLLYDPNKEVVLQHSCSIHPNEDTCAHYLTVLDYAYNHLGTEILQERTTQVYRGRILKYNEFWQRVLLNSQILIADIYDTESNKIRFFFEGYSRIDIRLIAIIMANRELKDEDRVLLDEAREQMLAFSDHELALLKMLHEHKCSFSRKGQFFTIYKHDFVQFFPHLASLQHKIFIKETGDRLIFSEESLNLNFRIEQVDPYNYLLKPVLDKEISAYYVHQATYLLIRNEVYSVDLPFTVDVTQQIFQFGYPLKRKDLVYYYAIVSRQLALQHCYLDFEEEINLPEIYDEPPHIHFRLHKEEENIIMDGNLSYEDGIEIPLSVIRYGSELVRFEVGSHDAWFYIPPEIPFDVKLFLDKLPEAQYHRLETDAVLVFAGDENIEALKKAIFELTEENWDIEISDELRKEFIYKVPLQAKINARQDAEIDWFTYDVTYEYKDFSFTHEELKKFFKSRQKFMKLKDGRLVFFSNKENFDQLDNVLSRSEIAKDKVYRLHSYYVPFLYHLSDSNPAIRILGDSYFDAMYDSILNRKLEQQDKIPLFLQPIMRSYQKAGFFWMKMLEHYRLGGILADEMGLGKTIQAISILSGMQGKKISLVICPKTLLFNWALEIEKFNRSLHYLLYEGSKDTRIDLLKNQNVDVIIASYSIIPNDLMELQEIHFGYIILDEVQHIKNVSALRTKAIKKLKADHKLALSGTPMENDLTELWSVFDFLMPGFLPSMKKFREEYADPIINKAKSREELSMMVSPFILRRKKKEVLLELPDKQEQILYAKMSVVQEKMYLQILDEVKKNLFLIPSETTGIPTPPVNFIHVLTALTRLRQITDHPALVESDLKHDAELSGKVELLMELVEDAIGSGKKLLVFSQFVQMLKIIRDLFIKNKINFEYLDGETKNRQHHVENFNNNNNIRVFLISLKAGGFGLNLTSADTVILVDPWWNPQIENQAIDRTHRIGQSKKVQVYKLITRGSVEEKIQLLQKNKRELFEMIIENGQTLLKTMDSNQLKELFTY